MNSWVLERDDSHPERENSLQFQFYLDVVGGLSSKFLSIHQSHISYTLTLCVMLTITSV